MSQQFKKQKKYNEIILVAKAKLNIIEVLISTVLIELFISHYEFVSVNNILEQYNFRKRTMKIPIITNSENIEA